MARVKYGRTFKTRKGRFGRYKYVNGRRVAFVSSRRRKQRSSFRKRWPKGKFNFRTGKMDYRR